MVRVIQWLLRIAGGLIILAVAGIALVFWFAGRSLPDYDRTVAIPEGAAQPSAPVEIVRDNANVPHIFGASDADVFYGLGYAHAQDRLWQMMTMRRTVQGRLSEIFGTRTLPIDTLIRRLDLYTLAQRSVEVQDTRTLAALEAYANGVNARLAEINEGALGRGAPEMFLFNAPVAPWQPADSIAMIKLMALQLSGHMSAEIKRARTSLALPYPARLIDILPDAPGSGVAALPSYASLFDAELPRFAMADDVPADPLSPSGL